MKVDLVRRFHRVIRPGRDPEEGMALVIALMLLSVLSLLGAAALMTTNIEIKISGNTRLGRTAFFAADGAGQAAGHILSANLDDNGSWPNNYNLGGVTVRYGDFAFVPRTKDIITNPDITFPTPMSGTATVDKGPTVQVPGASAVAAAGYEGAGKGIAGGGIKTVYLINTRGSISEKGIAYLFLSYDAYPTF
ncbi:MAG: PilX N-terminal domain-containing pilus assembly protein [Thermodesulfobacteriota bacterium]